MKIGIVITCKNLVQYTQAAIESIETKYPAVIIVVDDFSTDMTKQYLEELKAAYPENVMVITDPLTYSLSEKWNLGAEAAWDLGAEAVLICNNDIVFHPRTIDALVERMEVGDVGMVTAHNVRGTLEDTGKDLKDIEITHISEAPHPDFSCFLLAKQTWDKVGPFDKNFIPCYFEDGDYHLRMGKALIKAITTTSAPYLHWGSRTQNSIPGGMCPGPQFDKLREYLRSKHGTVPGEPLYDTICQLPFKGV